MQSAHLRRVVFREDDEEATKVLLLHFARMTTTTTCGTYCKRQGRAATQGWRRRLARQSSVTSTREGSWCRGVQWCGGVGGAAGTPLARTFIHEVVVGECDLTESARRAAMFKILRASKRT